MGELSKLPNIGAVVEKQLNKVGIDSVEKLKELGAEKSWLMIQSIDSSACIHRLLALEGAILGCKKNLIPEKRKGELKDFYNKHKI
ncbi:MAG: TfoX/Sxy family protein [Lachnospirales bacterium]